MMIIPVVALLVLQADQQPIIVEAERLMRNDPKTVVCKSERRPNSRFRERTCKTRAEWEEVSEAAKRAWYEISMKPPLNMQ